MQSVDGEEDGKNVRLNYRRRGPFWWTNNEKKKFSRFSLSLRVC